MIIEIDQSGKIEATSKHTVIAFSNGKQCSVLISGKEKQILEKYFRKQNKRKMFTFLTFTALIFLLIYRDLKKIDKIIIDQEYFGHEDILKNLLLQLIRNYSDDIHRNFISFQLIGKKSGAHQYALEAYQNKKSDITVSSSEIIEILKLLQK